MKHRMNGAAVLMACLIVLMIDLPATAAQTDPHPPNLRGQVMILVYHRFGDKDQRWTRSWSSFDADLVLLEKEGYRPITLKEYVTADFVLPPGTTPVVLTFDDSTDNQFQYLPNGEVSPDCALGHWMAFAKAHPEFPVRGVWFINPGDSPFHKKGQPMDESQRKIRQLLDMGNEIGNHTYSHPDFSHSSPEVVEREIALGQYFLEKWLPSYKIFSLALPFGNSSRPESIAFEGEWQGPPGRGAAPVDVHWKYGAVVRVGSNPAASPLVAGLDPLRLPRIQVYDPAAPDVPKGDAGIAAPNFAHWIDYFERHPDRRYWSDGQRHDPGSLPAEPEPHPKRGRG